MSACRAISTVWFGNLRTWSCPGGFTDSLGGIGISSFLFLFLEQYSIEEILSSWCCVSARMRGGSNSRRTPSSRRARGRFPQRLEGEVEEDSLPRRSASHLSFVKRSHHGGNAYHLQASVHARRTVGRYRDHWYFDCLASAGCSGCERGGADVLNARTISSNSVFRCTIITTPTRDSPAGSLFPGTAPHEFGWGSLVLPFMEQSSLGAQMNVTRSNLTAVLTADQALAEPYTQTVLSSYRCPSDVTEDLNDNRPLTEFFVGWEMGTSNYVGNGGWGVAPQNALTQDPRGIYGANKSYKMRDVIDGTSNTMAISERDGDNCQGRCVAWRRVGCNWFGYLRTERCDCHRTFLRRTNQRPESRPLRSRREQPSPGWGQLPVYGWFGPFPFGNDRFQQQRQAVL